MNRLILRYGPQVTVVILAIFAWVIYTRVRDGDDLRVLIVAAVAVWVVGAAVFIANWPRITVGGFKRAILTRGLGGGPIAVNTLWAEPASASQSAASGSLIATGTDAVLYVAGWIDLRSGPLVLHVPDMVGRYFSVQFTDPATQANVAYVGTRTTGAAAGDFVIASRSWHGEAPAGMPRLTVPGREALVIGRVFVASESDRPAAYALARQLQLSPLAG
jgi:hypothetical protein